MLQPLCLLLYTFTAQLLLSRTPSVSPCKNSLHQSVKKWRVCNPCKLLPAVQKVGSQKTVANNKIAINFLRYEFSSIINKLAPDHMEPWIVLGDPLGFP